METESFTMKTPCTPCAETVPYSVRLKHVLAQVGCALVVFLVACTPPLEASRMTAPSCTQMGTQNPAPPNIILFLVDDLGQQDTSVAMLDQRTALNARYRTPNLEQLAARGLRFSDAYAAAPVCTPSRTAILTGQAPARTHITYWTLEKDRDTSSRHARLDPPAWAVNGAQPTGRELPARLKSAGYRTMHVGKAHFGARGTRGADPCSFGFEVNIAGHAAGAPGSYLGTDAFMDAARKMRSDATVRAAVSVWDVPSLERWHGQDVWLDDVLAREASAQITRAVEEKKPFFLNFCPYGVHTPLMEDGRFAGEFASLDPVERAYASMVAAVDDALGQLMQRCEELGVLENTLIIFTSDNGGLSAVARGLAPDGARIHTHNAPLRSGKGSAYEGGLRVPFIVAGPGIVHQASACDIPIVGTDLYPTILAAAGVEKCGETPCDGENLLSLWRGGEPTFNPDERSILFHQPHAWGPQGPGIEPMSAVRRGDWKLIWFHDDAGDSPRFELFDLRDDVGEANNLAAQEREVSDRMRRVLCEELRKTHAQMSIDRATGLPIGCPQ